MKIIAVKMNNFIRTLGTE